MFFQMHKPQILYIFKVIELSILYFTAGTVYVVLWNMQLQLLGMLQILLFMKYINM